MWGVVEEVLHYMLSFLSAHIQVHGLTGRLSDLTMSCCGSNAGGGREAALGPARSCTLICQAHICFQSISRLLKLHV